MSNRVKAMVQWSRVTEIEKEKKGFSIQILQQPTQSSKIGFYGMLSREREPNFNFSLKMET